MKPIFFRTASFVFILSIVVTSNVFAQQRISLFETFTGPADPCVYQDETAFESAVNSLANSDASKIVHLNYYISIGGPGGLDDDGGAVLGRLSTGNGAVIYTSGVNREVFNGTGVRIDPTSVGSYSDWGTQIDGDAGTPEATITLNFATLDKTDPSEYKLHADVTVTALTTISDSVIIRYAITQDGVKAFECGASKGDSATFNDMAWTVTTYNNAEYIVCTPATTLNAGDTVHLTWDWGVDVSDPLYQKPANMKLVAFLEDQGSAGSGNYFVANAAILKKDIDTLKAPAPTLSFDETHISDSTLTPGSTAQIYFNSTNLPGGVNAFYSTNGGTTWIPLLDTQYSPINWTVPDTTTTDGKIKLVAVGDPTLTSTEIGTFSIEVPPSVTILKPQAEIEIQGGALDTIVWTKVSVDSVLLRYSLDNGAHYTALQNNADTFYIWTVPDTASGVIIQLVPDNKTVPAASVIDTIEKKFIINGGVANGIAPTGLTITNIFPNPASNGEEIAVQYIQFQPKPITVQLLDLLGRVVPETSTTDNQAIHLSTGTLAAGAYVVRLSDGTNVVSKRVEIIR